MIILILFTSIILGLIFWYRSTFPNFKTEKPTYKEIFNPLSNYELRPHDLHGDGYFGAPRGNHSHNGLDIVCVPQQPFKMPFECEVVRFGKVYSNDLRFNLVEIKGTGLFNGYFAKLMYLSQGNLKIGQKLKQFQLGGFCQDVGLIYGGITPHIHLELYKNNDRQTPINPSLHL